jgi:hypothetical protein
MEDEGQELKCPMGYVKKEGRCVVQPDTSEKPLMSIRQKDVGDQMIMDITDHLSGSRCQIKASIEPDGIRADIFGDEGCKELIRKGNFPLSSRQKAPPEAP